MEFNLTNITAALGRTSGSNEVLPKGRYTVQVQSADIYQNKSSAGFHLRVTYGVILGDYYGHTLTDFFNIGHEKPAVKNRAMEELSALCRSIAANLTDKRQIESVMIFKNNDFTALLNKPLDIEVDVEKDKPYTTQQGQVIQKDKNTIKKWLPTPKALIEPPKLVETPASAQDGEFWKSEPNW
jgi:hypothetical protein